jgi:hypothetical protein
MRSQSIFIVLSSLFLFSTSSLADENRDFQTELHGIEEDVNAMKKNVFSAKATLNLLRELVVQGSNSGSKATIWQVNDLGRGYVIESVTYVLDGKSAYSRTSEELNDPEMMIFDGTMSTGEHTLSVEMKLRGSSVGFINYVDQYAFNVQSSLQFASAEGQACIIRVLSESRSVLSYSYYERPNIQFQTICSEMSE